MDGLIKVVMTIGFAYIIIVGTLNFLAAHPMIVVVGVIAGLGFLAYVSSRRPNSSGGIGYAGDRDNWYDNSESTADNNSRSSEDNHSQREKRSSSSHESSSSSRWISSDACPDCDDHDSLGIKGNGVCSRCHGDGKELLSGLNEKIFQETLPCRRCRGDGDCPTCNGKGTV